ncbi:hypothetical protein [Nostoc sp.]|uniref:hypothetical protein n=1 Tax=Nostoc sp. TaxID=1180 RepID=UPI002FF9A2C5
MWLVAMNIDIGTILTAIGVFVAIFGAWWQIYRFKTENKKITDNIIEELLADWSCFQNKLEHKNFLLGCVEFRRIVDIHTGLFNDSSMKLELIENYPKVMTMAL